MSHRWKRFRRVTVTEPGTLYSGTPTVTISPPNAPRLTATATATIDSSGKVNALNMDSGGTYYDNPPQVIIAEPSGDGTRATATATISQGEVSAINITDSGSGYDSAPAVTMSASTGSVNSFRAQAAITMGTGASAGTVAAINVTDSGNFYDSDNPPTVTIAAPTGGGDKNYELGEEVTLDATSNGTIVTGEVAQWDRETGKLSLMHVVNNKGTFAEPTTGGFATGGNTAARAKITKVEAQDTAANQADEFADIATDFLDFSESNPFGEPEQVVTPASTPDKIVIRGTKSDPSFTYPKTYKIVANNITYNYTATAENQRNFYVGLRELNIPGLTVGVHSFGNVSFGVQLTYQPPIGSTNPTISLSGDGFDHLAIPQAKYAVNNNITGSGGIGGINTQQTLGSGDSAPLREGDSAVTPYKALSEWNQDVSRASTSMVWDSDATTFGMSNIQFVRNWPLDVAGGTTRGGSWVNGFSFGDNGRRMFYANQSYADSTSHVYGRKLATAYDISTAHGTEEIGDFSNTFLRAYTVTGDSSTFATYNGNHRITAFAWHPEGKRFWAYENSQHVLAEFALADSWQLNTATFVKGTSSQNSGGQEINRGMGFTHQSGLNLGNTYSMNWVDSGRKLMLSSSSYHGRIRLAGFSTPYDVTTYTGDTYNSHYDSATMPFHPANSYGNQPLTPRFIYKLAFKQGSQFNHDGTRLFHIHRTWSDSDYDSSSSGTGNGYNGNRYSLIRENLSTPFDPSTRLYHSQVELTNQGGGGPTDLWINGDFAFHPDGTRIFVTSRQMHGNFPDSSSNWTGNYNINVIEWQGFADSVYNENPTITKPNLANKPFTQIDSDDAWATPYLDRPSLTHWKLLLDSSSPHF